MSTYDDLDDVLPRTLGRSSTINTLDNKVAAAFALIPDEIKLQQGTVIYAVDTGAADAYIVTLPHDPGSYVDGLKIRMRPLNSNTGACTVDVNTLGVKSIKLAGSTDPAAGEIVGGVAVELIYSSVTGYFHISPNSTKDAAAAAVSAAAALVSQNAANDSAVAAAGSESAAETAKTNAETAETNAESAQSGAESAQTGAQTAQGLAETAQTGAQTAQGLAETAQGLAETAQGLAETARTGAETAETNAETAQGLAETAQTAAEAAQTAAEAVYDDFDDRYLGAKTSNPSTDNDGGPLAAGMLYYNTVTPVMRVYSGSVWAPITQEPHKDTHDPDDGSDPLDTANAAEISTVVAAGTGTSHSLSRADHVHAINHAITDNHLVTIDGTTNQPVSTDYAKFTANGLEGRSASEVMGDLGAASSGVNSDITSMTGLDNDGIPLAKVANAASDGANSDITSTTALTSITRATGGTFNIAIGSASGDDFTVDTDKLVVEGDTGNVGIGTTEPGESLDIASGNIRINRGQKIGGYYASHTNEGTLSTDFGNYVGGTFTGMKINTTWDGTYNDESIIFMTHDGGVGGGTVAIDKSGNVGIGIASPAVKLHITGAFTGTEATTTTGPILAQNTNNSATESVSAMFWSTGASANSQLAFYGSGDDTLIQSRRYSTGAVSDLNLQPSGGNVGIGTASPGYQLTLSTDSAAKPSTNTWTISSDERLKENIEPADLDRCYEIVKTIPLKRYTWRDDVYTVEQAQDRSKLGWTAQDVQPVFGKAVNAKPFELNTEYEDGIEEYEEQDFIIEEETIEEVSIEIKKGIPVQVKKTVVKENKKMLFDAVEVMDEDGQVVLEEAEIGYRPIMHQVPRMVTKTRPKLKKDVIEDCLDLNSDQIYAAMYGALQKVIQEVETLKSKAREQKTEALQALKEATTIAGLKAALLEIL